MKRLPNIHITTEDAIKNVDALIVLWKKDQACFTEEEVVSMRRLSNLAKQMLKRNRENGF